MKNKKKKLLIFLLSAACVTAGAFGISACKGKKDGDKTDPKREAYAQYVLNAGDGALSYEDWLLLIQQDIKPGVRNKFISSTEIAADGQITLTYSDGYVWIAGKAHGSLTVTYYNETTATVQIPSSASPAKKAVTSDFDGEYAQYTQSAGDGALSYDDWLALIKQDIIDTGTSAGTVTGVYVSDSCELILSYSDGKTSAVGRLTDDWLIEFADGTSSTVTMPKLFIVNAVDQHGNPVAGAWIQLSCYDAVNYTSVTVMNKQTDAYGKAYFAPFEINANYTYQARLADPDAVNVENVIPAGYELDLGADQYGTALLSVNFDEYRKANFTFRYAPDSFVTSEKQKINYKRIHDKVDIKEVNEPAVKQLDGGRYAYFIFAPYQKYTPSSLNETSESIANNDKLALEAATGTYRISVTADKSGANPVLYHYAGTSASMACDPDTGIPSVINKISGSAPSNAANPSLYSGTDYIEINLYKDVARGENIFGVYVGEGCNVTVCVERAGDAVEPPEITVIDVEVTSTILPNGWPAGATGKTLTDVPVDGSVTIVKGNDGFYHVGSKTGPQLLINLTGTVSRAAVCPIAKLPEQELPDAAPGGDGKPNLLGESVFIFVSRYNEDGFIVEKKDFNNVIKTFSEYVNKDGVYGVNDDLYEFLQYFASSCLGVADTAREYWWLLPCQYYA